MFKPNKYADLHQNYICLILSILFSPKRNKFISSVVLRGSTGIENGLKGLAFEAGDDRMHYVDDVFDLLKRRGSEGNACSICRKQTTFVYVPKILSKNSCAKAKQTNRNVV